MTTKEHDNEQFLLQFVNDGMLCDEASYFENYQFFRNSVASIIDSYLAENGLWNDGVKERFTEDGYVVAWIIKDNRIEKFWSYSFDGELTVAEFVESTLPLPEINETQIGERLNE
ncbi:hypothetical protein MHB77_31610 [Paenibacillus sp. FSL K6-3166]|uniref:hypothetical protein n=1 Tax=Paenibacillus sp. FSL K6-3166 TaxID=2921492 RepID=UPI0030F7ED9D